MLYPQAPCSHPFPSLRCSLQLFPNHILTLLTLLSLDSPFSPFFNVFLPSLLLFPSHCYWQQSAASSPLVSPLLSVFLHHPLSLNWPLNPRFFAAQTTWSSPALPHPHSGTPVTHRQCRQTNPAEFCHGFASSQGLACHSTCERRSIILHSRLGRTIKAQAQKQTDVEPRPSASHPAP